MSCASKMKIQGKFLFIIAIAVACFLRAENSYAAGPTLINVSTINTPTTWTKANSPYIIKYSLTVKAELTIEPGTVIKISGASYIYIGKSMSIKGSGEEKVIFTSIKDDSVLGDDNNDSDKTVPANGDWGGIRISDGAEFSLENVQISYATDALFIQRYTNYYPYFPKNVTIKNCQIKYNTRGIYIYNSKPTIENNEIFDNNVGIYTYSDLKYGVPQVRGNSIVNNIEGAYAYPRYGAGSEKIYLDATDNWWGDASGPYFKHLYFGEDNLGGKGNPVNDGVLFNSWSKKDPAIKEEGCQENCFSNVLFLPGIKASRLYKNGLLGTEDQLWIPNFFGDDLKNLGMDDNGNSLEDVYTKDVLDEIGIPLVGGNIYKSFLNGLAEMKNNSTINDYEAFAYDWRASAEDVVKNGVEYDGGITKSVVTDLQSLAENSKSKKVTIIAHSNGGLVAKAVMLELEKMGMADRVDKIIFVGTPQMGTPLAVLSMLYGYDESALLGTLISREDARVFAENIPGAYGLLPSEKYLERTEEPLITFSSEKTRYKDFLTAYGENIDSLSEFKDFLLGVVDGRTKPEASEVEMENILNASLLEKASEMHSRLDAWTPPAETEVIQIAGWGLDTVSGVDYAEKEVMRCDAIPGSKIPSCINIGKYEPVYEPKFTVDGDAVVTTPSALMFAEAGNTKKYWVDLYRSNKTFSVGREHKDILEFDSVLEFISDKIRNIENASLPQFMQSSRPSDYENAKPHLRMSLYSPLNIHLYDEAGNHTGPKAIEIDGQEKTVFEENIPNSYYYQMGERKYVGFPADEKIRVEMKGYALGSYTLKLEEVQETMDGEQVSAHSDFSNLPVTADTVVKFDFSEDGLDGMTDLKADMDGDGENDYVVEKALNGTAELPLTVEMIGQRVDQYAKISLIVDSKTQEFLRVKLRELAGVQEMISKLDGKNNENSKNNQIKLFNKKTDDLIVFVQGKFQGIILSPARETLIKNLESIKI